MKNERNSIMKALRYLLMMVAVMGVLSLSARTPTYGTTYKVEKHAMYATAQTNAQMPEATMNSTGSAIMRTGSALPQAAVTGTTTADETVGRPGKIRKDVGGGSTADDPDPDAPEEPFPIGDAMWPLMLLALAYVLARAFRRKRA